MNRAELRDLADLYFARFSERLDERIAGWETKLDTRINSLQLEIARLEGNLEWVFIFWAGTIVPLAGLILALGKDWL